MRIIKDNKGTQYCYLEDVKQKNNQWEVKYKRMSEMISNLQYENANLNKKILALEEKIREKNYNPNLKPRDPKYPESIQREIAKRIELGESKRSLANEFNVSRATILSYTKKVQSKKLLEQNSKPMLLENISDDNLDVSEALKTFGAKTNSIRLISSDINKIDS